MPGPAPNAELLSSLGKLVRGLSALFWGLPVTLVVCVQTAKIDWFQAPRADWFGELGLFPPVACTGLLLYAINLLGHFQKQERPWRIVLDRARIFALLNLGFSPFLYWHSQVPEAPFLSAMVFLMAFSSLLFLLTLNPVLYRLAAMLPDETTRAETRLFTSLNVYLLTTTLLLVVLFFAIDRVHHLPQTVIRVHAAIKENGLWPALFLVLLPMALTMALVWKIKEVILASVFGADH